jgi:acyl-CoA synthetase (AMP-forming)/AMP-acid ligase II
LAARIRDSVLARSPSRWWIVVARDHEGEDKRLVAYVVAGPAARVRELRAWLRERLPEFMTPAAFVMMDALPFTPNGKVDSKSAACARLKFMVEDSGAVLLDSQGDADETR